MQKLSFEDLRNAAKLLSVSFDEERLKIVASFLAQNFDMLRPLAEIHIPKDLEPTSYLKLLSHSSGD